MVLRRKQLSHSRLQRSLRQRAQLQQSQLQRSRRQSRRRPSGRWQRRGAPPSARALAYPFTTSAGAQPAPLPAGGNGILPQHARAVQHCDALSAGIVTQLPAAVCMFMCSHSISPETGVHLSRAGGGGGSGGDGGGGGGGSGAGDFGAGAADLLPTLHSSLVNLSQVVVSHYAPHELHLQRC